MSNFTRHQWRLCPMVGRDSLSRRLFGRTRLCGPTLLKFICAYSMLISFVIFFTAGCGSPRVAGAPHPDPELERNAVAARSAYAAGSVESASVFYAKALDRARLADQPGEISRLAYNLAACRARAQQYSEALELLDEAEFEAAKAGFTFPEVILLRAEILRQLGKTGEALAAAKSGLGSIDIKKGGLVRLQLQIFLAELACDGNDGKLALKELDAIDPGLLKSSDPAVQAGAAHARGRALLIEKRFAEAAACLDNAAGFYQTARRYADMAVALQAAGSAYESAGKRPEAIYSYYRSARSLALSGEITRAQESFNKADKLANESNDQQMLRALARLKPEIFRSPASNAVPVTVQGK